MFDQVNKFENEILFLLTLLMGLLAMSCSTTEFISRGLGILFLHDFSKIFHGVSVKTLVLSEAKFIAKTLVTGLISYEILEIAMERNLFIFFLEDLYRFLDTSFFSES